ncbi:hypothetical protein SAMN05428988_3230 [Chitinophaga sp. YR573]|uniref:hypothetical protein n=1 Tax=Chitinophaga sp. YR573 TaxID=1881040 RepID=UPI0008D88FC9|nr:hypothetical protein [Chitinophaga sp. YR573]SEW21620.1 hypothetical protein SAMN05428988_3230 [Chitinophaga sp. YR573]
MPTMRNCQPCNYISGNECTQYTGPTSQDCGLVNGNWYIIDDLISALTCAGFSTTTTSSTTISDQEGGCITLLVEGFNQIYSFGGNGFATLVYKLYGDMDKTQLIYEKSIEHGNADAYTLFNAQNIPGPIYPVISAFMTSPDGNPYYSYGSGLDLIIVTNDMIRYARTIPMPVEGNNIFPALPALPRGRTKIYLNLNAFDSNSNPGQGIIALGGSKLISSYFEVNTILNNGGDVGTPKMIWPDTVYNLTDYMYCDFDTVRFGSAATSMTLSITGSNNESVPVKVEFTASDDPSLSFTDTVAVGQSYEKVLDLTIPQVTINDFLIRILK